MAKTEVRLDKRIARKVLAVVGAGLVKGMGVPKPGEMCVEAAVCYAMGLPHSDKPSCVSPFLRDLKISLNDRDWSSNEARAKGLRRLAVAQLGSAGALDEKEFRRRVADLVIRVSVPKALRAAASKKDNAKHKESLLAAAKRCEAEGTRKAALKARDAADAASSASSASDAAAYAVCAAAYAYAYAASPAAKNRARDKSLADFAESVVQILIDMKAPGTKWLDITEAA